MNAMDYQYWNDALRGKLGYVPEDQPQCGFYEASSNKKKRREACAVWRTEDGTLMAVKNGAPVDAVMIWPSISHKPITEADYRSVERGEGWPDQSTNELRSAS